MVFITVEKIDETKGKVVLRHNFPEQLTDNEKSGGILIDSIPEPVTQVGKIAVAYYMYDTKTVVYEYEEIPKTQEEINAENQTKIALMQKALDDLLLGGAL